MICRYDCFIGGSYNTIIGQCIMFTKMCSLLTVDHLAQCFKPETGYSFFFPIAIFQTGSCDLINVCETILFLDSVKIQTKNIWISNRWFCVAASFFRKLFTLSFSHFSLALGGNMICGLPYTNVSMLELTVADKLRLHQTNKSLIVGRPLLTP